MTSSSADRPERLKLVSKEARALTEKEERLAYYVMSQLVNGRCTSFHGFIKGGKPRVEVTPPGGKVLAPEAA